MKKSYTMIIAALAVVFSANAQNRGESTPSHVKNSTTGLYQMPANASRATGDTLMWMQLPGYYINPTDATAFEIVSEDIDMLTTNNPGVPMDFGVVYSTDSSMTGIDPTQDNFYHPWELPAPLGNDTAFFWWATSWFSPVGVADNWLEFGPITIPAGGASLKWFDRTNRYRDGYEVLITSAFSSPLDFTQFTGTPIFTETDDAFPSATYAVDTTWEAQSVQIPASFNGMQVAIAFHHNANDMDVLYLDEIRVIEGPMSVAEFENGVKVHQNMPNPTSGSSVITYELENSGKVALNVYDVAGKLIDRQDAGTQSGGVHNFTFDAENLAAGVYYYSLSLDNNTTAAKKMVVIK